jgi:hypothetical protein
MSALQQQAFRLAASELGMASAAWLFVRETAAVAQDAGVAALRDELGRAWPVLDAVCAGWLAGVHAPPLALDPVLPLLHSAARLVLVGHEALWVDALLQALPPTVRVGLVLEGDPQTHWPRVLANHGERVEALSLANFQSWAGPRSVLLTFVYGATASQVFVLPAWLRATGPDVRMQFRSLLGWRILDVPLEIYPRWLVAADAHTLTDLRG